MLRPLTSSFLLLATLFATACSSPPPLILKDGRPTATMVMRPFENGKRETIKVYHHVVAPDGRVVTKGEGGKFEHHRGLFVGWNKTQCDGKSYDFWHMGHGESQRFVRAGDGADLDLPDDAEVLHIDWCAPDGTVIVHEVRGLRIAAETDEQYALQMRVRLTAANADVELAGDPQHAGQQFRALQRFAEDGATPVSYLRPTFAKEHGNDVWTDCEWIAAVLPMPGQPVTVLRIEGKDNPGKTTWSTRPYGRFGATRTTKITKDAPLQIDQYYVVANDARDIEWCRRNAAYWRK